jgi:hypothetical protein
MDKNVLIDKIMIGIREIDKHISAIKNFMISSIFKIEYNITLKLNIILNELV